MGNISSLLTNPLLHKFVGLALFIVVILVIIRVLHRTVAARIHETDDRRRLRKTISLVGYTLIGLFAAFIFSNQLGGLSVSLGVASAGIAFALQETIASVAAWLQLTFGHFYRVGDRIRIGGVTGDVIQINVFLTTLMEVGGWVNADQYSGRIVRVANSSIYKEPVYNYSADFAFLWDEITVPVKYGSDRQLARSLLERVAQEVIEETTARAKQQWPTLLDRYDIEEVRLEPKVFLIANDNWLEYTVRYLTDYQYRRATKDRLFERIMDEIDHSDGRVSIASGTYDIVGLPPLDVRVAELPRVAARPTK